MALWRAGLDFQGVTRGYENISALPIAGRARDVPMRLRRRRAANYRLHHRDGHRSSGAAVSGADGEAHQLGNRRGPEHYNQQFGRLSFFAAAFPGNYSLDATISGFKTFRREGIMVEVDRSVAVPVSAPVGSGQRHRGSNRRRHAARSEYLFARNRHGREEGGRSSVERQESDGPRQPDPHRQRDRLFRRHRCFRAGGWRPSGSAAGSL